MLPVYTKKKHRVIDTFWYLENESAWYDYGCGVILTWL